MSKFLMIAAEVVGAVAITVASAGTLAPVATASVLGSLGISATAAAVATVAGLAAGALGIAASLFAKKPSQAAVPTEWRANPDQGIDLVFGDAYNAGGIVYRQTYGDNNKYETIVTSWSLGPVAGIDTTYVDGVAKAVIGEVVQIDDLGKMYQNHQLGLCPEPTNLLVGPIDPFGWTAECKLSGKAAIIDTFIWDQKGGHTFVSIPNMGWRGRGLLAYDPRKDDTYPGGAGPQRANDQSTWAFTKNGPILALTFAIGWLQNGHLAGGAGIPVSGLIVDQFVEAANVSDANGWTCGGVKSTTDNPYDVFTDLLQSGGAEPLDLGARVGCLVKTPRVRLATITKDALAKGKIKIPTVRSRRDRINAVSPTYLQETQVTTQATNGDGDLVLVTTTNWAMAPGAPIVVDDYVTEDGKQRRRPISYPLVQCYAGGDAKQIAQLARYDIEDSREIDGISLPLKLMWYGYKPGDCLGVQLPEAGIEDQDIIVRNRSLEPSSATVTMTARSETAAKHAYALGQTTTPPASPSIAVYSPFVAAPAPGSWTLDGETLSSASGSLPALLVTGASDNDLADAVIIEQRIHVDGQADDDGWYNGMLLQPSITRLDISSVAPEGEYDVSVRYRVRGILGKRLILGPATAGVLSSGSALQQAVLNSWILEAPVITASSDGSITIIDHTRRYPDGHADVAVTGTTIATGFVAGETRMVAYDDPGRVGGAVAYAVYDNDNDAHASSANPGRHYVGFFTIPSTGSAGGGGGSVGGGYCVTDDTPIRMANVALRGPGVEKVAADIQVGDHVWTQHETTLAWGAYPVTAIEFVTDDVFAADGYPNATAAHLFWKIGEGWVRMDAIGTAAGQARVAKITVADAHTYVSAGVLSHNIKAIP